MLLKEPEIFKKKNPRPNKYFNNDTFDYNNAVDMLSSLSTRNCSKYFSLPPLNFFAQK